MDFVSFSLNYWEDLWQSRHQIMGALAAKHKVLFVSPPFGLNEILRDRSEENPKSGLVHRTANLHTLVFPRYLPETYRFQAVQNLVNDLRERRVRRAMKALELRDTVLFIWHPQFAGLIGRFGEKLTCYYVDDDFSGYAGESEEQREALLRSEDDLLRRADVVFANGPVLLRAKNRYGNAINVPMTADFGLFSRSRLAETKVPPDLASVPHPRIGFIGNVNDKVDLGLTIQLAKEFPSCSFVFVGPINVRNADHLAEVDLAKQLANIFFLGSKTRESLPNYIKGLDVCTLCYRKEGWARSIYPLKLHEYLASGKPIIGTGLESIREFSDVVRIADTPEEWREALRLSLAETNVKLVEKRVQIAYENRLETRIAIIETVLEDSLRKKASRWQNSHTTS
jgi:glycosyltransferase involved in cell wall biosynthesis